MQNTGFESFHLVRSGVYPTQMSNDIRASELFLMFAPRLQTILLNVLNPLHVPGRGNPVEILMQEPMAKRVNLETGAINKPSYNLS